MAESGGAPVPGETALIAFRAHNRSKTDVVGTATFNVSPAKAGPYFYKLQCFCFTEQRLKAGERREMTVVFFVDPELAKNSEDDDLNTITLSYTMYPVRETPRPVAGVTPPRT